MLSVRLVWKRAGFVNHLLNAGVVPFKCPSFWGVSSVSQVKACERERERVCRKESQSQLWLTLLHRTQTCWSDSVSQAAALKDMERTNPKCCRSESSENVIYLVLQRCCLTHIVTPAPCVLCTIPASGCI